MYLPKSKYSVKTAKPGEFLLDGKTYVGPVMMTYLGETYAGTAPDKIEGKLEPITGDLVVTQSVAVKRVPTVEEYESGSMERYFKCDQTTRKIIEIMPEQYPSSSKDWGNNTYGHVTWYLTGSLDDTLVKLNGYRKPGIRKSNLFAIAIMESIMPGISSSGVLSNPEQFVKESL